MKNLFGSIIGLATVLTLGACADINGATNNVATYPQSTYSNGVYPQYGVVQSIELVRLNNSGIGIGTIAGAVIGGIVGNQVGAGNGNTAATVLGAAGGAYAGHELEKRSQPQTDGYRLSIRMQDGSHQTVTQGASGEIRVGDRVQVDNGVARLR